MNPRAVLREFWNAAYRKLPVREPDRNFDPPEDDFDEDDDREEDFDGYAEYDDGPIIDRDCDYWNRIK